MSMERVLSIVFTTLASIAGTLLVGSLYATLFLSQPTGHYYMDDRAGAIVVKEDVRFGEDRTIYVGESSVAFRVMQTLNAQQRQPQPAVDAVVVPNGT